MDGVIAAASSEVVRNAVNEAVKGQDVVFILTDGSQFDKKPLASMDTAIKVFAVVGVVSTVYHGYQGFKYLKNKVTR